MYRKFLLLSFLLILIVGLLYLSIPFFSSLGPNSSSLHRALQLNVLGMKIGASIVKKHEKVSFYISRHSEQVFSVFMLPMQHEAFLLPEFDWQRPVLPCKSFIQPDGFQCLDEKEGTRLWYSYMIWDKNGKYVGKQKWGKVIPDLMPVNYVTQGSQLIILGV